MPSIFGIQAYDANATYSRNDIVKEAGYFYYLNANSSTNSSPFATSSTWGGMSYVNSVFKTEFIWSPSYGLTVSVEPKVKSMRFGDGYEQRYAEGINNSLIKLDLTFDKRNSKEAAAILHFLQQRKGAESFYFTPPEPYSIRKNFVCRSWDSSVAFHDNYSIRTSFEEVSI